MTLILPLNWPRKEFHILIILDFLCCIYYSPVVSFARYIHIFLYNLFCRILFDLICLIQLLPWSLIYHLFFESLIVKVRGQIGLYRGGTIVFGLSDYPVSEFELVAEELLMSDSIIKVCYFCRVFLCFCNSCRWPI